MEILNTLVFVSFNSIPLFTHIYTETYDLDRENAFSSDKSSMQLSAYMQKINESNKYNDIVTGNSNNTNSIEVSSVSGNSGKHLGPVFDTHKIVCDSMLGQILVINTSGLEECQYVSNHSMQMKQMTHPSCIGIECSYVVKPQPVQISYKQPLIPAIPYNTLQGTSQISNDIGQIKPEGTLYIKNEPPKVIIQTVTVKPKPEVKIFKELIPSPPQTITESIELPRATIRIVQSPRIETVRETVSSPPIISTFVKSIQIPPETLKIFEPPVTETIKQTVYNEIKLPRETISITIAPKTETMSKTIVAPPITSTVYSQIELPPETVRVKIPAKTKYISQYIPTEPVTSFITKKIVEPSETVTVENVKTVSVLASNINEEENRRERAISKTVPISNNLITSNERNNTNKILMIQQPTITQPIISVVPSIIAAGGIVTGYNNLSSNMFANPKQRKIFNTNISCDSVCDNEAVKRITIRPKNPYASYCSSSSYQRGDIQKVNLLKNRLIKNGKRKTIQITKIERAPIVKRIDTPAVLKTVQLDSNNDCESETFRFNPDYNSSCVYRNGILSDSYKFNRRGNYSNGGISLIKKYKTINELKHNLDLIYDKFLNEVNSPKEENRDKRFVNYLFESIYEKNQNLLKEKNEKVEKFNLEIKNLLKNKQFEAKLNKNKIVNNYLKKLINSSPVINKGANRVRMEEENICESSFITERNQLIKKLRKTEKIKNLKEILKKKLLLKKRLQKSEIFRRIKEKNLISRLVGKKIQKIKNVLKSMTLLDQKSLVDILLNSCENFCDFDLEIICKNYAPQETFCKSMNSSDDVVIFLSELIHN